MELQRTEFSHRGLKVDRHELASFSGQRCFNGRNFLQIFMAGGVTPAQVALAWVLSKPAKDL